jgi:3-deoxy-D-manno-octulosonic-acid transferase
MSFLWPIYYLCIQLYRLSIKIAARFNGKAYEWLNGRRQLADVWKKLKDVQEQRIWVHCASLGEFEQGKPLIEALKEAYPGHKIVLTFFSPSGYQVRKNTPVADYVFYMPLDGPSASRRFIKAIQPRMVFFVKYEFWYFYGRYLAKKKIPFFCVSAIFRENQVFFKWYGGFFKYMLMRYNHLFVQDQASLRLLYKNSISKVTVAGDTRFDAVCKIAAAQKELTDIESFKSNKKLIVVGSSWKSDMHVLKKWMDSVNDDFRFVIAPHEIKENELTEIESTSNGHAIRYSKVEGTSLADFKILIIDSVGLLSSIYRYADYVYIGGGFGVGIHNILEAAVFGAPIFFGPNYEKFNEAVELVKLKSAFVVNNGNDLLAIFNDLNTDAVKYNQAVEINKQYVETRKGATKIIVDYLKINAIS